MTSQPLVRHSGNRLITTSLAISNHFGKKHKDVLKAIRNLECSPEFAKRNFALCFQNNHLQNGKPQPYYEITRDGFVFLCMGFTGSQAAQWKEKYIAAFNALEAEVNKGGDVAADMLQVDRDVLQYAFDRAQRLEAAYLAHNQEAALLVRYRRMGLMHTEIARLMGYSTTTVRDRLKSLAELGLDDYCPRAKAPAAGLPAAQQSLGLEG